MASPAPTLSSARLLIHAVDPVGTDGRHFEFPLRRMFALRAGGRWHHSRLPLRLQIDDLEGHGVHTDDDAGPLVDVRLPAGTYRVSVHLGALRRSYTMTLLPGASFDLHLRLTPDRW
jgi:hypothetical protein